MANNYEWFEQSTADNSLAIGVHNSLLSDAFGPTTGCQFSSSSPDCLPEMDIAMGPKMAAVPTDDKEGKQGGSPDDPAPEQIKDLYNKLFDNVKGQLLRAGLGLSQLSTLPSVTKEAPQSSGSPSSDGQKPASRKDEKLPPVKSEDASWAEFREGAKIGSFLYPSGSSPSKSWLGELKPLSNKKTEEPLQSGDKSSLPSSDGPKPASPKNEKLPPVKSADAAWAEFREGAKLGALLSGGAVPSWTREQKSPGNEKSEAPAQPGNKSGSPSGDGVKTPSQRFMFPRSSESELKARRPSELPEAREELSLNELPASQLEKMAQQLADKGSDKNVIKLQKFIYEELIKRYDARLPDRDFDKAIAMMSEIQKSKPASDSEIIPSHQTFAEVAGKIQDQIRVRQEFAGILKRAGMFDEARDMGLQAEAKAQRLVKKVRVGNEDVVPVELIRKESDRCVESFSKIENGKERAALNQIVVDKYMGQEMGLVYAPRRTAMLVAEASLGTNVDWSKDVSAAKIENPDVLDLQKAYEAASRARNHAIQVQGYDPLEGTQNFRPNGQPSEAGLFDLMIRTIDGAERQGKPLLGRDGKPVPSELIERIKKERAKPALDSLLQDLVFPLRRK